MHLVACSKAKALSLGLLPHEECQKLFLETPRRRENMGRLCKRWSCCMEEERQLGKPGEVGRPCWRMERRSGGKEKLRDDSKREISESVRPCSMVMLEAFRCCMRVFAYAANEKHIRFGRGFFDCGR